MSETEAWKGVIVVVPRKEYETLEEQCRRITAKEGYEWDEEESIEYNFYEAFWQERKYVVVEDQVYMILSKEDIMYNDIFEATKNSNGTINFLVKYYNGACGFTEAIETAIKGMEL